MRIGGQPPGDVLRLAEGFEEAVSVSQLSAGKFKVWGAGGIRRYGLIAIPERIRKIVIYSQHGRAAVFGRSSNRREPLPGCAGRAVIDAWPGPTGRHADRRPATRRRAAPRGRLRGSRFRVPA